jgi:uncharacterized membrane protein YqjE
MAVPENSGSGENPSLFSSLRSFWGVIVAIFYTRLDLVTAELEDEAIRIAKFVASGLLSVIFLSTAFFFAMFFLLALFWDTQYRLLMLGLIFGIYFVGGVVLFFIARNMFVGRPKFLAQTLAELRRDVESLRPSAVVKKEESQP